MMNYRTDSSCLNVDKIWQTSEKVYKSLWHFKRHIEIIFTWECFWGHLFGFVLLMCGWHRWKHFLTGVHHTQHWPLIVPLSQTLVTNVARFHIVLTRARPQLSSLEYLDLYMATVFQSQTSSVVSEVSFIVANLIDWKEVWSLVLW